MTVCLSPNGSTSYALGEPPSALLVATIDGVARLQATGAGTSGWRLVDQQLRGEHISSLLFEPRRGGHFAGVHGEGLYFSADDGRSWEPRMNGLTVKHVFSLFSTDGPDGPVLFAGTEPAHLFKSLDYGFTWTELPALREVPDLDRWTFPAPPHEGHVKTLAVDPRDDRVVLVGIEQGALLKTTDGGAHWVEIASYAREDDHAYKDVHRVLYEPGSPDHLYMTSGIGFYLSTDGGESWEHVTDRGFRIGYPDQLHFSPADRRTLFMAGSHQSPGDWRRTHHADSTIMRSRDGGRTWHEAAQGLPEHMRANIEALALASYPGGFSLLAATTEGHVYRSDDAAESWSLLASGLPAVSKVGHYRPLQTAAA